MFNISRDVYEACTNMRDLKDDPRRARWEKDRRSRLHGESLAFDLEYCMALVAVWDALRIANRDASLQQVKTWKDEVAHDSWLEEPQLINYKQ